MNKEGIEASSATYRKATNIVAKKLKMKPNHGRIPSDDFKEIAELIPRKIKGKAIKWYEMGIKRGLIKATDMILNREICFKGNILYCPKKFKVKVRIKFAGEDWKARKFIIRATDIGFR